MNCKLLLVAVVCAMVVTADAWSARRAFRRIKKKLNLKKIGCKIAFGLACPVAVGAAGTAVAAGTAGAGSVAAAAGVVAGQHGCRVGKKKCKRDADMMLLPFSDDIRDYDSNGDKQVSYEEFVFAIMRTVDLADPSELQEPFLFADENADGTLDTEEFNAAPFIFARLPESLRYVYQQLDKLTKYSTTTDAETTTPSVVTSSTLNVASFAGNNATDVSTLDVASFPGNNATDVTSNSTIAADSNTDTPYLTIS